MEGINGINSYNYQRYYTNNPYNINPPAYGQRKNEQLNEVKAIATAGILQGAAIVLQKISQWCGTKLMQGNKKILLLKN